MAKPLTAEQKVLIIGASHGGISMAEQLRKQGFDGAITLIDREASMPMERPPLSKAWLLAAADEEKSGGFLMRQPEWFQENKVEFKKGCDAVSADPVAKTVTLANGDVLAWDHLVLATGAVPRALPLSDEVEQSGRVHVLRVPDDAEKLSQAMTNAQRMAIIGGGYIGLEVAASARKRGLDVTVIEMAPRILARVASPEASQYFHDLHQAHGTNIMTNAAVDGITSTEDGLEISITTPSGQEMIKVDLALAGIGVIPDLALADDLGIDQGNGFIVDGDYRTGQDNIWAIGDVALATEGYTQGAMRIESVHHAQMSAEIAAAVMMGARPKTHEVPWFWSEQYDKKLQSAGLVPQGAETIARQGKRDGAMSFWSFDQGVLTAVESIADPQAYMIGKTVITEGTPLTPDQIADPEFVLKSLIGR